MNKVEKKQVVLEGTVISSKTLKTVTVLVERQVRHSVYGKIVRRSTKIHAHDESALSKEGDRVRVIPCAPVSKTKHWRVVETIASNSP